jgi:hypothetical protein
MPRRTRMNRRTKSRGSKRARRTRRGCGKIMIGGGGDIRCNRKYCLLSLRNIGTHTSGNEICCNNCNRCETDKNLFSATKNCPTCNSLLGTLTNSLWQCTNGFCSQYYNNAMTKLTREGAQSLFDNGY